MPVVPQQPEKIRNGIRTATIQVTPPEWCIAIATSGECQKAEADHGIEQQPQTFGVRFTFAGKIFRRATRRTDGREDTDIIGGEQSLRLSTSIAKSQQLRIAFQPIRTPSRTITFRADLDQGALLALTAYRTLAKIGTSLLLPATRLELRGQIYFPIRTRNYFDRLKP